jgi:alpha-galactosidase
VSGDGVVMKAEGCAMETDWLMLHSIGGSLVEPFKTYMHLSKRENTVHLRPNPLVPKGPPVGWCSWYHYFEHISEKTLLSNLECMQRLRTGTGPCKSKRIGFNLFQVDDGYQSAWGDWSIVNKQKFPSQSLYSTVTKIKQAGMIGGIWMAPFSCDKHSELAKKHPDWVLKKDDSKTPSNSGNCGKFFYGLDLTHPGT